MEARISDYIRGGGSAVRKYRDGNRVPIAEFVEDYINGRVDVVGDFQQFMRLRSNFLDYSFVPEHFKFVFTQFLPEVLIHSQKQDEDIGRGHYDRGNDFFNYFLGPRMIYTSAFYHTGSESLEEAQDNKMKLVCEKLQLKSGETLLDIGCGWGTLLCYAAQHYGADVTGVTVARHGENWANEQIAAQNLQSRARVLNMDYRDIPKQKYNKISCLEMAEHVGVLRFQKFMKQVHDMLEDDGLFYLQIAGLRAGFDKESLVWGMFMNKYIFPGADASMPLSFVTANLEGAGFEVHSVENVGIHYSRTIDQWYQNWMRNEQAVRATYGQWWFRLWQVFLAWSVEIAAQGNSTCFQIVAHKNKDNYNRNRFIGANAVNLGERDLKPTTGTGKKKSAAAVSEPENVSLN